MKMVIMIVFCDFLASCQTRCLPGLTLGRTSRTYVETFRSLRAFQFFSIIEHNSCITSYL